MTIAIIGIITSIFSVYYYLRVVYYLYMKESTTAEAMPMPGVFGLGALAISMLGIVAIGIYPRPLFAMAGAAARALLQ